MTSLAKGLQIGNYRIEKPVGAGGMGEVYLAHDTKLNRPVALKFISGGDVAGSAAASKFLDEIQALARVSHPNIITIYGADTYKEQPFFTMEYVEGSTLDDLIDKTALSLEESLRICIDVCAGLQRAHECGLVHRDINPNNILIGSDGPVKILDFGLAIFKDLARVHEAESVSGTLQYMSPEQLQDLSVDHRSDLFSLGVVLYQLVSRRLPFRGEYEAALVYSIINETPDPLSESIPDASTLLQRVVMKALEKNPRDRYQSAASMAEELNSLLAPRTQVSSAASTSDPLRLPSVAILHFKDISPDKSQEFFCDGIAEEIISALAKVQGIRVASPASVSKFKGLDTDLVDIGEKLGVESVLEGSVRRTGGRLRIATQLVDISSGYCIWSEIFDRDIADVFLVQDEISKAIVSHLKIKLIGEQESPIVMQRTNNPEAYSQYLRGRYFWNRRYEGGLAKSIKYFQEAIELDPLYAPAYAGLSDSFNILAFYNFMAPREACPKARAAAVRAMQLDPNLAEAHTAMGWVDTFFDWNFTEAEREFKLSLEINPGLAITHQYYALFLLAMRRFEEALHEMRTALVLDPLATIIATSFGAAYYFARNHAESIEEHLKALQFDPDFAIAHAFLAGPYVCLGSFDLAISECMRARSLASESVYPTAFLAYVYGMAERKTEAHELLDELLERKQSEYISSYHMALVYCGLRDFDKSLEYLENAFEERDNWMLWLNIYPVFDPIRDHPRFLDLAKRVGLP